MKLITPEQAASLKKGDIIKMYPSYGGSREVFDERDKNLIDTYEIRSFNANNEMLELVMTGASLHMFSPPGDVGRIFIKSYNLSTDGLWWKDQSKQVAAPDM